MLVIVRAPIERLPIAVGASEIDRQRSAGVVNCIDGRAKNHIPHFPSHCASHQRAKPVTNVHWSTLYGRHPGKELTYRLATASL
jgi:hypothetical protein